MRWGINAPAFLHSQRRVGNFRTLLTSLDWVLFSLYLSLSLGITSKINYLQALVSFSSFRGTKITVMANI
jgi:hypothetical protein